MSFYFRTSVSMSVKIFLALHQFSKLLFSFINWKHSPNPRITLSWNYMWHKNISKSLIAIHMILISGLNERSLKEYYEIVNETRPLAGFCPLRAEFQSYPSSNCFTIYILKYKLVEFQQFISYFVIVFFCISFYTSSVVFWHVIFWE